MRHSLLALVLALPVFAQDAPDHPDKIKYPALSFAVPDPAAMRTQLPNGMAIYAIEEHSLPLVQVQILVRAGTFWQAPGKAGVAGLCATVMRTGGTATREPKVLDEQIEMLAAELGIAIEETQGTASLSVLSKDLDAGLEILFDVLRNPAFRQEKLDLAKDQLMQAMKARNDATRGIEGREVNQAMYGDFPLNVHPTKASVESITREDLIAYHKASFAPSAMIVAASGDFSRAELEKKLVKFTAGWDAGASKAREVPKVTAKAPGGVRCFHKEGANINQGRVTISHLGIDIHHPDVHPLRVMNYILGGGGFTSRLMQKVRSDEGLAYDVHSAYSPELLYPGLFAMRFQSKSESCLYAAKLCVDELERIRTQDVTEPELKNAVSFYLDAFPKLFFATKQQTVTTFARAEMHNYPKNYFQTWREKLAGVTAADVKRVASEHCRPENLVFTFVGNMEAIRAGDGKHDVKIQQFGKVVDVPLADPMTLERPKN